MLKKVKYYQELFKLLLTEVPPEQMIEAYVTSPDTVQDNMLELADWCSKHAKLPWMDGLAIIDAVTDIFNDAAANGILE